MADVPSDERKVKISKNGKVVKRRSKNPEEWHKQKQKRLRIAGQEYINSSGKVVPSKRPGPDCNCRRRCFQKVPEDVRIKTFEGFYAMKTHDEQNAYLFGLMRQVDVKRKRVKSSSRRTCTFEYFIRVKGRETQVCQTAFKNIHAITERKVRVLCKKMDDGVMFPSDNRGKNSHRRSGEVRLPNGVVEQIKNHIYSVVHTHRLKDFIRLDKIAGLEINISKMWKDYIKMYDPDNLNATLPKSKRSDSCSIAQPEPTQTIITTAPTQEQFSNIGYPGSGHLMNIAENYFSQQHQYQPSATITTEAPTASYYQTQTGQIVQLPSNTPARPTQAAYIVLQAKQEPQTIPITFSTCPTEIRAIVKTIKRVRRKGPAVKQWRYSNVFHEEINGAALAAIKTRLGMYYAESDAARKKAKSRPLDTNSGSSQSSQTPPITSIHTHTVTLYS